MKKCTKCHITKSADKFYIRKNRNNALTPWCKNCHSKNSATNVRTKKIRAIAYMGGCCQDCNGIFHPALYDFHHISDKDMDWSSMQKKKFESIKTELEKCILLCSNCHRLRHTNLDLWPNLISAF